MINMHRLNGPNRCDVCFALDADNPFPLDVTRFTIGMGKFQLCRHHMKQAGENFIRLAEKYDEKETAN